jgi:uncharacterized protein YdeI (YjbR/CyaY-like superfamily)
VQIKIFNTSAEFREWLENNHDRVAELWLGFYNKRTDKKCITYREALDEALCFGWIDGVRKSIDETATNSGSLRERRRVTGAQLISGGQASWQSLAAWPLRG